MEIKAVMLQFERRCPVRSEYIQKLNLVSQLHK